MRKSLGFEILMTALVLVIIAGVAGALLGLVNHFTEVDEDELLARKATAVYDGELVKYLAPEGVDAPMEEKDSGEVIGVYVPKEGDPDTYVIVARGYGAYKGSLELLVNITKGKIVKIAKYEANETPGLGSKALDDSYFKQFYDRPITVDFKGFDLVKRPAETSSEVSAVTGASKSSTAVTNAVNAAVKWYQFRAMRRVEQ